MIDTSQKIQSYFVHVVELASELCSQSRWGKHLFIPTPQVDVKEHFSFFWRFFFAHIWGFAQFWWELVGHTMPDRKEAALKLTSSEKCLKVGPWDGRPVNGFEHYDNQLLRSFWTCVRYHVIYDNIWYVYAKFEFLAKAGKAQESLTAGASQYLWVIHVCKTHVKAYWIYACIFSLTQDSTAAGT